MGRLAMSVRPSAALAALALGALNAFAAEPPRPRVMVILDTSRSMKELPRYSVPSDVNVTIPVDPALEGDYDPALDNNCQSKFCAAKKVLYHVIPQYTGDARIGLSTYYQYVVNVQRNDTQLTTCTWDVMGPANQLRTFHSMTDLTGSGSTVCPGGPADVACGGGTRAHAFPDSTTSTMGPGDGLQDSCVPPALVDGRCTAGALNCYRVTKTAVNPHAPLSCDVATWPLALPASYGASSHCSPGTYPARVGPPTLVGAVNPLRVYVPAGTLTCPGVAEAPNATPSAPPALTATVDPPILPATPALNTLYLTPGNTVRCSTGAPCQLFSSSSSTRSLNTARHWYGFFNDTFVPSPTTSSGGYTLAARLGAAAYLPAVLTGGVTVDAAATCPAGGRMESGALSTFGIFNASSDLGASPLRPPVALPASTDQSPTRSGPMDYLCTPEWPCHVTLAGSTPVPGGWVARGDVYAPGPLTGTQRVTPLPAENFWMYASSPAATTCPTAASLSAEGTPPTNFNWSTPPAGCSGAGLYACRFANWAATSVATAPVGECLPQTRLDGFVPATCSWNGKSYVEDPAQRRTIPVTRVLPFASTCVANPGTVTDPSYSGCSAASPCTLVAASPLQANGPAELSGFVSAATPPTGFSGAYLNERNRGSETNGGTPGLEEVPHPSCGSGELVLSDARCGSGSRPCLARALGYVRVSDFGCGAENGPCWACRYQPVERQWSRPQVLCNYTANARTYTVDRDTLRCNYSRPRWALEEQDPDRKRCEYEVGARRYDFSQTAQSWCEYWAIKSTVEAPVALYTYQYLTHGTELIGRARKESPSLLCSADYDVGGNPLAAACRASGCAGLTPITSDIALGIPAGSTCKLQYGGGGPASTTTVGRHDGRYASYLTDTVPLLTRVACEELSAAVPASPQLYKDVTASPRGFCSNQGAPSNAERYLVSDWYHPATANDPSIWDALFPTADVVSTNNTPFKRQGFGAQAVPATAGTGALPNTSLFVPLPDEALYDQATQASAIRAAVSKCVMPGVTPPGADGRLAAGACVSDLENPSAPGVGGVTCSGVCSNAAFKTCSHARECWPWQDFTPLYGSLQNTFDYLIDRWNNAEDARDCRDYYIVLATDGAENTPSGYVVNGHDPNTSVEGLVGSFRDLLPASPRSRPDVKTFVIAFGENITSLDQVARAGGTNQAFTAGSVSELQTALNAVFTAITQGTFSRSRPALTTDGRRLYAAQFIRPSSGPPDWSGLLTAFKVAPDGSFSPAWEHGTKLDDGSHPARTLKVGLKKKSDGTPVVGDFAASNAELVDQLDDALSFDRAITPDEVINFLSHKGEPYVSATPGVRSSALGPIVTSAPVVVARSPFDVAWGGESAAQSGAYAAFVADTEDRPARIYFQANDGMLHSVIEGDLHTDCTSLGESALTCPNGREDWSFLPGSLVRGVTATTEQPTLVESLFLLKKGGWNEALLDNTVTVADVCGVGPHFTAEDCLDKADWKTILVGSMRAGGRGLYAMEITRNQAPDTARLLWSFWDTNLGFTYSVPAVGRVKADDHEYYVALFGGGADDPHTGTMGSHVEGKRLYVLNALDGTVLANFDKFDRGPGEQEIEAQIVARPALWRRPSKSFLDSVYVGAGQALFTVRFAERITDGSRQHNQAPKWKPDELFDPTSNRNDEREGVVVKVRQLLETPSGDPLIPPTFSLVVVQDLPLAHAEAPPIMNRPKLSAQLVASGALPDLYVGTGDVLDPSAPGPLFQNGNYFYAIHDKNEQPRASRNDGMPLWVMKFPGKEQVVSEPAILSGCIVVATFTPPAVTTACGASGDTILYGFAPLTGELTPCLTFPAGTPWAGTATSVVKLSGAGIPSDLVVVNDNVYLSTSEGGLQRAPVRQAPRVGFLRSFRRIR